MNDRVATDIRCTGCGAPVGFRCFGAKFCRERLDEVSRLTREQNRQVRKDRKL